MVRMQIQFTEAQAEKLRAESARHGVSISEIVRRSYDAAPPLFPDRTKFLSIRGTFASGIPDLVENHDLYVDPEYKA
jgi:hypothetical protein